MKQSYYLKQFFSCCYKSAKASNLTILGYDDLYASLMLFYSAGNIDSKISIELKSKNFNKICPSDIFNNMNNNINNFISDLISDEDIDIPLNKEATELISLAKIEARLLNSEELDVEHLLLAFSKKTGKPKTLLESEGLTYERLSELATKFNPTKMKAKGFSDSSSSLKDKINDIFGNLGIGGGVIRFNLDDEQDPESEDGFEGAISGNAKDSDKLNYLEKYAKNMNKLAEDDSFDPVYGRTTEIDLLIKYLGCKKKNNVILLGDPGVGKTTIIEGLCQRIVKGTVPEFLKDKIIYSLDLNSLVAGTKFRGQYEERLQGIIKEVTKNKNIIIFIDEFHNLVGNGSSDGNGDASNVLKPYLARGEFQCIGSTTFSEYRKYVEKDGALRRRFHNIPIYEPTDSECLEILKTIAPKYEQYHDVKYSEDILKLCIDLSKKYITDRFLPDKAIDILDLSGSEFKLNKKEDPNLIKLREIQKNKRKAVEEEDYEKAIKLKKSENSLQKKIDKLKSTEEAEQVTPETVYKAIAKISGVPEDNIGKSDMAKLRGMKSILESSVIGQDEAIETILMSLQKNSLGFRDPKKPIATILCVGPSGTGKTHICKQIATEFFGSDSSLIRFDMSEYTEKHEITKLIGASASYVGYDDEPLFYKIKRKPYSVVLFDEIEKADPGIYPILLNILDEGYVTLANGTVVDFKNTIIVITGNIGTKELLERGTSIGFSNISKEEQKQRNDDIIMKQIKKTFAPELINRLSNIIFFNQLTDEDMGKICDIEVKKLEDRLKTKGYNSITISDDIKKRIISGCDLNYGARDLQREVSKIIEESICKYLLNNDIPDDLKTISISEKGEDIIVEFTK